MRTALFIAAAQGSLMRCLCGPARIDSVQDRIELVVYLNQVVERRIGVFRAQVHRIGNGKVVEDPVANLVGIGRQMGDRKLPSLVKSVEVIEFLDTNERPFSITWSTAFGESLGGESEAQSHRLTLCIELDES